MRYFICGLRELHVPSEVLLILRRYSHRLYARPSQRQTRTPDPLSSPIPSPPSIPRASAAMRVPRVPVPTVSRPPRRRGPHLTCGDCALSIRPSQRLTRTPDPLSSASPSPPSLPRASATMRDPRVPVPTVSRPPRRRGPHLTCGDRALSIRPSQRLTRAPDPLSSATPSPPSLPRASATMHVPRVPVPTVSRPPRR